MLPVPPDLGAAVPTWQPNELFWIVKNGLKYTGMPGWAAQGRDDEVWAVVAFLQRWLLTSPERARQSMRFLSSPLWRAYTSTYVEGYRLLRGWLDARPADVSLTARFGRLLP